MKKISKIFILMIIIAVLGFGAFSVFAQSIIADNENNFKEDIVVTLKEVLKADENGFTNLSLLDAVDSKTIKKTTIVDDGRVKTVLEFTDKDEMETLMDYYNEQAPEGYSIEKISIIKLDEIDNNTNFNTGPVLNSWDTWDYYIASTTYCGTGWSSDPVDLIRSSYYYGPCQATMTVSETWSSSCTSTLGISVAEVSASVGFTIGSSLNISDAISVPVAANKYLNLKAHKSYTKVTYDVWDDRIFNPDEYWYTGSAYNPSGIIFTQFLYTQ